MATKAESADLVLKLYDLRREKKMRKARNWVFGFAPQTAEDYIQAVMDPDTGAYLRMVTSYWDMAAALVNQDCIDSDVFNATNSEHFVVFAKLEPILADLRQKFDRPTLFTNLETMINNATGGPERLRKTQEWLASLAVARAAERSDSKDKKSKHDHDDSDERSAGA
jgi:hypothetical protein